MAIEGATMKGENVVSRTCFVMSPIGSEGSDVRKHADNVFNYIIAPAVEECNEKAVRADMLDKPGRITQRLSTEIASSDFAIAIGTGHNPNVFYEVAIAHAAGVPVIMLIQKGEGLPFDVFDVAAIEYDFDPSALDRGEYTGGLVRYIQNLEENGFREKSVLSSVGTEGRVPDLAHPPLRRALKTVARRVGRGLDYRVEALIAEMHHHMNELAIQAKDWSKGELSTPVGRYEPVLVKLYESAREEIFSTTIPDYVRTWSRGLAQSMINAAQRSDAGVIVRVFLFNTRSEIGEKEKRFLRYFADAERISTRVFIDDEQAAFAFPTDVSRDFVVIDRGVAIGVTSSYDSGFSAKWYFRDEQRGSRFREWCDGLGENSVDVGEVLQELGS